MSLENFLHFLMAHNATIIEVLLGLTLLFILFLSIRIFLTAKDPDAAAPGAGAGLDLSQLEETMKQLLEKAGQVPTVAAAGSSEDSQKLILEISELKNELQSKQKQIEELASSASNSSAPAAGGVSDEDRAKLEAQLQELQAKLSEYEIISEDIADLSFYKEQNAKLQKELDSLKAGGPVAVAASAAPVEAAVAPAAAAAPAPAAPAAPKAEPEIVGRSKVAEAEAEVAAAAAPEPVSTSVDDDLMAEFAAAVEKQKSGEPAAPAPAPAATASEPAAEAGIDLGEMDMEKMMAEAATIKADVPEVDPEKALGTSLDENKLLQEAAALESVTDEDKKLMGDFENFVKKNES